MSHQIKNVSKEIKIIKKRTKILELKSKRMEMKEPLRLNSRFELTDERIHKLENRQLRLTSLRRGNEERRIGSDRGTPSSKQHIYNVSLRRTKRKKGRNNI